MIGVGFIYIFLKILKGWKDYSNIKIRCWARVIRVMSGFLSFLKNLLMILALHEKNVLSEKEKRSRF